MGEGYSGSSFKIFLKDSNTDVTDSVVDVAGQINGNDFQVVYAPELMVKNISGNNIDNATVTQYIISAPDSAEATFCWSACWGPTSDPEFTDTYGVKLDADSSHFLTPEYVPHLKAGTAIVRYKVWDTNNSDDFSEVTIRYNLTLLAVNHLQSEQLKVYPNPVQNGHLTIQSATHSNLVIFNMSGQVVFSKKLEESVNTIDVASLKSGVYIYLITTKENKTLSGKFIKE